MIRPTPRRDDPGFEEFIRECRAEWPIGHDGKCKYFGAAFENRRGEGVEEFAKQVSNRFNHYMRCEWAPYHEWSMILQSQKPGEPNTLSEKKLDVAERIHPEKSSNGDTGPGG